MAFLIPDLRVFVLLPFCNPLRVLAALAELRRMRGVQFDPQIVDAFRAWAQTVDLAKIVT